MTEVTKHNFYSLYPEIEKKMRGCNFISVDAEYTGLHSEDIKDKNTLFDTPDQRYLKLKDKVVSKFIICQVGIALFERCVKDPVEHLVHVYNFYVFPVSFDAFKKREIVGMQVSCLNFLGKNDFDFNKFIKEGIPYLNREKTEGLRRYLAVNRHFMNTCEFMDPVYFPNRIEFLKDDDIEDIVEHLYGFSKIIRLMNELKKPVVGHNMLLDLMLIYHQFIAELPPTYKEFKTNVGSIFPEVFDTKCVASALGRLRLKEDYEDRVLFETNLFALYTNTSMLLRTMVVKPIIIPQKDGNVYHKAILRGISENLETVEDAKCHAAGFDALVTGSVFIKLGYLAARPKETNSIRCAIPPTYSEMFKRLTPWKGAVNIARSVVSNINLLGDDPKSNRPDWIRIKHTKNILDPMQFRFQLAKYGDLEIEVVNDHEVIIACGNFMCYRRVYEDLEKKGYSLSVIKMPSTTSKIINYLIGLGITLSATGALVWFLHKQKRI